MEEKSNQEFKFKNRQLGAAGFVSGKVLDEIFDKVKRTELYNSIYSLVKQIPRKNVAEEDYIDFKKTKKVAKQKEIGYKSKTQTEKNIAWFLPRPKKDRYKGGKPLYCEEWLIDLAKDILGKKPNLLNLFCGMNKYGFRIDVNEKVKPDLLCDAHSFADKLEGKTFNLIIADPPYSTEEARDIYGTPPLKYKKWTAECDKVLEEGGLLMVYHKYVMPNPNPEKYIVVKRVFIGNRTMHLPRVCIVFQKKQKHIFSQM